MYFIEKKLKLEKKNIWGYQNFSGENFRFFDKSKKKSGGTKKNLWYIQFTKEFPFDLCGQTKFNLFRISLIFICAEKQTDRQTDRQTNKHLRFNCVAKTSRSARLSPGLAAKIHLLFGQEFS